MIEQKSSQNEKWLLAVQQNETLKRLFSSLTANQLLCFKKCRLLVTDFDGVLTNNKVWVNEKGEEFVRCDRSDGFGMKLLQAYVPDVRFLILSTEANKVVKARAEKMGIACQQGLGYKQGALEKTVQQYALNLEEVAYIGNDVNDLTCLTIVGLPIVVADAYPSLDRHAKYTTSAHGGDGAFREVCELILLAKLDSQ